MHRGKAEQPQNALSAFNPFLAIRLTIGLRQRGQAARKIAKRAGVLAPGYIVRADTVQWFPWLGTRGLLTLELHARSDGIAADCDALSITYKKINAGRWRAHLESIVGGERTALDLAKRMAVKIFEKFDDFLGEELLDEANARDRLDLPGARLRAEQALLDHAERRRSAECDTEST